VSERKASRPTIVIGDDFPAMLQRVADLLAGKFDVVARVSDCEAAIEAVMALKPDVAVLDIEMPVMGGIEVGRRIRGICATKVILLTAGYETEDLDWHSMGAHGFVLKTRMRSDLVLAIEEVLAGRAFLPKDKT
jgi:DNA-binding NarL/FixJ family response regulator